MSKQINRIDLYEDKEYWGREGYNGDAISRYEELYTSGKTKPLLIQKGTNRIIDGFHRNSALIRRGIEKVDVEEIDVSNSDIRAEIYRCNAAHGVPYSKEERNKLIEDLYIKDRKTQEQISEIIGIAQSTVSAIIGNIKTDNADKRQTLNDKDMATAYELLKNGETQESIAKKLGVSQSTLSERLAKDKEKSDKPDETKKDPMTDESLVTETKKFVTRLIIKGLPIGDNEKIVEAVVKLLKDFRVVAE
ncbi:MAG: hypothetical protein PHX21_05870 [bacterium]|nr:hypothetical protein [bacterium]